MTATPQRITVSHYMPETHGTHTDFILPWARAVEHAAGDQVRVDVHDGGSPLGLLVNQFAQVAGGSVDVAHSPASLPDARFPLSCLVSLPFLCGGAAQGTRVLWSLLQEGRLPEYRGFKVLALHADSGAVLHTSGRPVTRLEDLAGLRLRTPAGPMAAVLAALGAVPVPLHPPQIQDAVRTGEVDGAVMAWDVLAYTQTAALLPFHLDTRLFVSPLYFLMNQARYEALSHPVRYAVDAASEAALVERFGGWWDAWERPGRDLAEFSGHTITQLAPGELDRWRAAAEPAVRAHLDALAQRGVIGAHALYVRAQQLAAQFAGRA